MFDKVQPAFFEVITTVQPQEATNRVINFFIQTRAEIRINTGAVIQAARGSELKARMVGTLMGGIDIMPRLITVEIFTHLSGSLVRVRVEDNFGFGSRIGIKQQVYNLMAQDAYAVLANFPEKV